MTGDVILIRANQERGVMPAREGDCVYTTFPGNRHTPVMRDVAGCITTRVGELAVVVPRQGGDE